MRLKLLFQNFFFLNTQHFTGSMDRNHSTIDINLALSLGGGEWGCVKVTLKIIC